MTLSIGTEQDDQSLPVPGFAVHTVRCDALRANVRVTGDLDAGGAAVLAEVIGGHVRAGRRFLRLHIGGIRTLTEPAITVIAAAHDRLLDRRGTMILTGVSGKLEAALRAATPGSPLLMLPPTAAEQRR